MLLDLVYAVAFKAIDFETLNEYRSKKCFLHCIKLTHCNDKCLAPFNTFVDHGLGVEA